MSEQFLRQYALYITGPKYKIYEDSGSKLARQITDPIRITFEVSKTITREPNSAKIRIYNLSPDTEREIIHEGSQIILSVGYENPGIIFKGQLFQPIRGKESATDYYLDLYGLDGDAYLNLGFMSGTIASNQTRRKIAEQILRESNLQLDSVDTTQLPEDNVVDGSKPSSERAKVIFGKPGKYLSNLSKLGNSTFYVDNNEGKFFNPASSIGKDEAHLITTETGMIDFPQQIDYGVQVKCLINPAIRLGDFIKIDNKSVILQPNSLYDQDYYSKLLNSDGIYRVIKLEYSGDSRGSDWYCTLTAVTQAGYLPAMLAGSYGFMML